MSISRNEQFKCQPDELYQKAKSWIMDQMKEFANKVEWDDSARKGIVNYTGAKASFEVSDNRNLKVDISIGFPASWQYKEKDALIYVDKLYSKMKEFFP